MKISVKESSPAPNYRLFTISVGSHAAVTVSCDKEKGVLISWSAKHRQTMEDAETFSHAMAIGNRIAISLEKNPGMKLSYPKRRENDYWNRESYKRGRRDYLAGKNFEDDNPFRKKRDASTGHFMMSVMNKDEFLWEKGYVDAENAVNNGFQDIPVSLS